MTSPKHNFTILMTACIAPKATTCVQRKDPLLRLQDYQTALRFWLHYQDSRITAIVFVDNSGYDLSSLKNLAKDNPYNREIEFLQIIEPPLPPPGKMGLGYGYGEGDLLDQSFIKSRILAESNYIIKTTGRLYFPALSKLITKMKPGISILIDGRRIPFHKPHYLATTLFIVKHDFYMKYMYNLKEKQLAEQTGFEVCYYNHLMPLYKKNKRTMQFRFPVNTPPIGIGAHWNKNYTKGFWRLIELLRGLCRIFLPFLWF